MSQVSPQEVKGKQGVRRALMFGGVFAVFVVCAWFYSVGGRYIETENAYIKADKVMITPEVAGRIIDVNVKDNGVVSKGDTLFTIDPEPFEVAVAKAKAQVAEADAQIQQLKAEYSQKKEDLAKAEVEAKYSEKEYKRRINLVKRGAVSQTEFNDAERDRDASVKAVSSIREEIKGILAALAGDEHIRVADHPVFQAAIASLEQAKLDLKHTKVTAPMNGTIGTAPRVGDYARTGVSLVNLLGCDEVWVEANFKETELTLMEVGQPVEVEVDTYPGHLFKGHVESISPATGSEFSILPAQNSSGNWVKVVQRVAVRISLDHDAAEVALRSGMSSQVAVDIGYYPHSLIPSAVARP